MIEKLHGLVDKHDIWSHVPFFLAATRVGEVGNRLNTTRIMESLIIAGLTGAITLYGVQQKMDVQISEIRSQMAKCEVRAAEDRAEALARDRRIEDRIEKNHTGK